MENFEPTFKSDGYEIVYEFGADLNSIPNNNVNDLYKDMWKPFERQKLEPIKVLPKDEYEEKLKKFFEEIKISENDPSD